MQIQFHYKIDEIRQKSTKKFKQMLNPELIDQLDLKDGGQIDRVESSITKEDFIKFYELPNKPVSIKGLADNWNVSQNWTFQALLELYKNFPFKISMDDDGNPLKASFDEYYQYIKTNQDENPLYLFEGELPSELLERYTVPKIFEEDIFKYLEHRRPQFRWLLVGPKRSGSGMHVDPHYTSAWNTSLQGRKRWIFIPPGADKKLVTGKQLLKDKLITEDDLSCSWRFFYYVWPKLKLQFQSIECIQYPGETIFVPGGWWHAVLNLDDTIAVTQNFVSNQNFPNVWRIFRKESPGLSMRLLQKLPENLKQIALDLNKQDNYEMLMEKEMQTLEDESEGEEIDDFLDDFQNQEFD